MSNTCDNCGNDLIQANTTDSALINCAKIISEHTDVNSTIEKLLEILCEFVDGEYAFVYERDYTTNNNDLSHVYLSEKSTADFMTFKPVSFDAKNSFSNELAKQPYIFLRNVDAINQEYKVCEEHLSSNPDNNILVLPLIIKGKIIGVAGVANLTKHCDKFELSVAISHFLSSCISIKYTADTLKEKVIELDEVQEFNNALKNAIATISIPDFDTAINALLKITCDYYQADRAYSFELDKENATLINNKEVVATDVVVSCITNLEDVPYDLAYNWVNSLKTDEVFYKKIYDMDTSKEEYNFLITENIIDFALFPLNHKGVVIGAIGIDNPKRCKTFKLLGAISNVIANSLGRH